MNFQSFGPLKEMQAATTYSLDVVKLTKLETALKILPTDTSFAIVVQALERDINDSFWSTVAAPTFNGSIGMGVNVDADQGLEGRFIGYFAVASDKLRVYKNDQLYLEDDISNVSVNRHQGEFVVSTLTKKFKVSTPMPIQNSQGHFTSTANGFNGGFNPFFDLLQAQGAKVTKPSNVSFIIFFVFVLLIIGGFVALTIFGKKT